MKNFKLTKDEILDIILDMGGATATDKIVVEGKKIGYMYREHPVNNIDSGWRFFEGNENEIYLANNLNSGIYDVNTICNYDPAIIPYLNLPYGIELERNYDSDSFIVKIP